MSFRLAVVVALISQVLGVAPYAQGHPDFSGRWTLVPERSVIQGREGPITVAVFGTDFTVQRESNTLLVRVAPDLAPTYQVNLDGTPTLQAKSGPDDRLVRTTIAATWEGESLVLQLAQEAVRNGESTRGRSRRRLTLNPDHTLRVEMADGHDRSMVGSVYRWLEPVP